MGRPDRGVVTSQGTSGSRARGTPRRQAKAWGASGGRRAHKSTTLYDDIYFALAYKVTRILPSSYLGWWEAARACLDQTVARPRIKRPFTATAECASARRIVSHASTWEIKFRPVEWALEGAASVAVQASPRPDEVCGDKHAARLGALPAHG